MKMSSKAKTTLAALAVAVVAGFFWVDRTGTLSSLSQDQNLSTNDRPQATVAPVAVSVNNAAVQPTQPVTAKAGQQTNLALTSHSTSPVTVTVPGLEDTPVPVNPNGTGTLVFTAATPGTYPIMEEGTTPNTRSVEGGTSGYDVEVGTVVVPSS